MYSQGLKGITLIHDIILCFKVTNVFNTEMGQVSRNEVRSNKIKTIS